MSYAFDSNDAWDSIRVCRYHESCTRLLDPHGCDSCACREDGLRHDENGEPYHLDEDALDL
ncbi:MAG: hypothetical protein ACLGXA_24980 [Acidobacteriota bacterium]